MTTKKISKKRWREKLENVSLYAELLQERVEIAIECDPNEEDNFLEDVFEMFHMLHGSISDLQSATAKRQRKFGRPSSSENVFKRAVPLVASSAATGITAPFIARTISTKQK